MNRLPYFKQLTFLWILFANLSSWSFQASAQEGWTVKPNLFEALTEPPCSYVSTEHRKGFVKDNDKVIAWLRGPHNGGAIPLRHFLSGPRIINDTYGLFFYDPEGGYVAAYKKDYGYTFYGWRKGVMLVKSKDGTIWSALSGKALKGPQKGQTLERIPSMTATWAHWLMLHPESTAYNLFKGDRYKVLELPNIDNWIKYRSQDSLPHQGDLVLGIENPMEQKVFPLDLTKDRACFNDTVGQQEATVFWYGPTQSAVSWNRRINGKLLTFRADTIAPETAPFMDNETNSRWTLAGRAVDGPLRGTELSWIPSIQCRSETWKTEYPESTWYQSPTTP